ncbi:hypothetical protein [Micromonospora sp. NPDC005806]|uniref:hypothetical protein n=1 Tax=Micromonospora sp. NPDC005806 TaxID=3364234 RepID=UPI0036801058
MTTPLEDLIRTTLSDLAEEAPTVQDQLIPAERRARKRRHTTVTLSVAGAIAAVLVGAPIAVAATHGDAPPPAAPRPPAPTAVPSISGPAPTAVPSPSGPFPTAVPSPRPSRPGGADLPSPSAPFPTSTAVPSPSRPAPSPTAPVPSPSPRR